MKLEIDIHDYMSDEEIKDECKHVISRIVHEQLKSEEDIHRFMSNSSYHFVWDEVDALCPENMREIISAKIPEIVNELSSYCVFRPKDAWQREDSKGWIVLQAVLSESKPLIEARICELIQEISLADIQGFVYDDFENVINNLKKRQGDNA